MIPVYSVYAISIAAKEACLGELRVGTLQKPCDLNITSEVCRLNSNINIHGDLCINTNHLDLPEKVNLMLAGKGAIKVGKIANLQGTITSKEQLELRAEGELIYDISKLHAERVILQVSKVAQMQFPNNVVIHDDMIDDNKEEVEFTGNKLKSPIVYELIGQDSSAIQILNASFFSSLKIHAPNNHVVIGAENKIAHLLGKRICIDASYIELYHGNLVGTDVLLLKSQNDITFGAIDMIRALAAGKPNPPFRPRYIGSKLLHIHAGRKLTMHQAKISVPGVMWLRAKDLDSKSTSVNVLKDTYIDIEQSTIDQIAINLSAENYKILYPNDKPRACVSHIGSSLLVTHGTMHISPNSRIAMNTGVIYAGQINGPLAATPGYNHLGFSYGSHHNVIVSGANMQRTYKQGVFRHLDNQHIFRSVMNSLILDEVSASESLEMLHDEYFSKPNLPIDEQDVVSSALLFKAIGKAVIKASKRAENAKGMMKPSYKGKIALMEQLWYLRELRANIPLPVKPGPIDEQLFAAIKKMDLNAVKDAIANGASINAVDPADDFLYSPLQLAIVANKPEIAKFLVLIPNIKFDYLTAGANPKTALDLANERASLSGYPELIPIVASKTPPSQRGVLDADSRRARNVAQLQVEADMEAQVMRLQVRDEDILNAFYMQNTKELLEAAKEPILDARKTWLETIEQEKISTVNEQKLVREALAACMTGDNLEAILKLKNLDKYQVLWEVFCACQPLQLAIKHKQVKAAACLVDNGVDYLTALSQEQDISVAQAKEMDFTQGGMLDVLSQHMQQDLIGKMQSEDVAYSKEQLSLTMTIFAQLLINKSQAMSGYNFNSDIDAKLEAYFGSQVASLESQQQQVEEAFTKASEQYLQEIHKVLDTHGGKISITRFHYHKLLKQILDQYHQELAKLMEEQRKAREAYAVKMRADAKKARKKGLFKMFAVAIAVGICAVAAPQLLATVLPNLGTTGVAMGTGAITGGVSSAVAGANRGNILKSIAIGAGSAGLGNLAGNITSNSLPNLTAAESKLLSQMSSIAASNVPGTLINGGNYLENVAFNAAGSVLSANLPTVNLGKLSSDEIKEVAKVIDKTANILISATPALIGRGDTKEKLLRYAGLATQLTTQNIASTVVENGINKANALSKEAVPNEQPEVKPKTPDATGQTETKGPLYKDIPKQTKSTVIPQQKTTKFDPAHVDEVGYTGNKQQNTPSEPKLSSWGKTKDWLIMAKRALQGDTSREVLEWQKQNRQATPNLAKFTDGVTAKEGEINQAMRQNKQALLNGVDSLIAELDTANATYGVNTMPDIFNTVRVGLDMLVPGSTSHARANIILPQAFRLQNIVEMFKANNVQQPKVNGSNGAASSRVNTFNKTAVDSIPNIGPPPIIPMMDSAKLRPPYQGPLRSGDNFIAADKDDLQGKPLITPVAPDLGKIPGKNIADNTKLPTTFTTPIHGTNKGDNFLGGFTGIPESARPSPFITPMYDGDKEQNFFKKGKDANSGERNLPPYGQRYFKAPEGRINGLNDDPLIRSKSKTPVQGGGKLRDRWEDSKGLIYEWDFQEGHFEIYSKSGNNHLGAFNRKMEKIKDGDPRRRVEP